MHSALGMVQTDLWSVLLRMLTEYQLLILLNNTRSVCDAYVYTYVCACTMAICVPVHLCVHVYMCVCARVCMCM